MEVVTLDTLAFYNDVTSFVFWETAPAASGFKIMKANFAAPNTQSTG